MCKYVNKKDLSYLFHLIDFKNHVKDPKNYNFDPNILKKNYNENYYKEKHNLYCCKKCNKNFNNIKEHYKSAYCIVTTRDNAT